MRVLLVPNTVNLAAVAATVELVDVASRPGASRRCCRSSDADACRAGGLRRRALRDRRPGARRSRSAATGRSSRRCISRRGRGAGAGREVRSARVPVRREPRAHARCGRDRACGRGARRAPSHAARRGGHGRPACRQLPRAQRGRRVARGLGRVVAFDLAIDGHRIMRTRADGIIVATATGSTAYALSAGGPVVAPGFGGMVVVPVAPHTLRSRPIVTDASDIVEITLPDPTRADACLIVDGDAIPCRAAIERVTVTRGATTCCSSSSTDVTSTRPSQASSSGADSARGAPRSRSRAHRGGLARVRARA